MSLVHSAVAAALCLVPAVVSLYWSKKAARRRPEDLLVAVLGGTGLRMGVVLAAGMSLYSFVPYFHQTEFWLWLLVFYLLTLGLEMGLLIRGLPTPAQSTTGR
jgi:hypothetical protein